MADLVLWHGALYDVAMAVYIDDQQVELSGERLSGVLAAAREYLRPRGRLIVEISVDGRSVTGEQLETQANAPVSDSEVRLASAAPDELVCSALDEARTALDQARDLQMAAAELLQQDQTQPAMKKIAEAVILWQQTQEIVIQSLGLTGIALDELRVDGRPSRELVQELIDQLRHVRQLVTDQDSIGLADTLAYEWPQTVELWDRLIEQLADRVRAEGT